MSEHTAKGKTRGVCAGIVLYNPEPERLLDNISAVLPQVGRVIAVDNGSPDISGVFRLIEREYPGEVEWIFNKQNRGVAFALNQLVEAAGNAGFPWLLTMDQDSVCGKNMVERLMSAALTDPAVSMVCPYIVDINLITIGDYEKAELPELEDVPMCITSGCLTSVAAVKGLGGFNNELFIDHVDHEMCVRLRLAGHRIIRANRVYLLHEQGHIQELYLFRPFARLTGSKWLARPKRVSNHPPVRVYYQTRNLLYLLRTYPGCMGKPNGSYWASYCRGVLLKLMKEPQKLKKLSAFLRGARDGIFFGVKPRA